MRRAKDEIGKLVKKEAVAKLFEEVEKVGNWLQ
jgi:hypothetical protein